nr:substrate-binding domain-containing protein [Arthrobacter sp. U41]
MPQEIALTGYDDTECAAAAVVPPSSIRQPSALIGSTALELLLREASRRKGFYHARSSFLQNSWSGRPRRAGADGAGLA